ncbi:MAG TPA: hypothetical protein VFY38_01570 [Pseudonocardia sp.]|nr:hypothetical protein [Pseudonocardia sp.]
MTTYPEENAMTTALTDDVTRIAHESREAATAALSAWVEMAERYARNFDPKHPIPAEADAQFAVDTAYDLAGKLLAGQRAFATTLVANGQEATEAIVERARAFVPAQSA